MADTLDGPEVSVAIPTRNRAGYLAACIDSVLAQEGVRFELIICDNASDDGTADLLGRVALLPAGRWLQRVRIERHPSDIGMVGNWNSCLRMMEGRFGVVLSDDDLMHPGFLRTMVDLIGEAPMAFCQSRIIDGAGTPQPGYSFDHLPPSPLTGPGFIRFSVDEQLSVFPSAVLFRTGGAAHEGFKDIGNATDLDMRIRLATGAPAIPYIRQALIDYRIHASSLTRVARLHERTRNTMRELRWKHGVFRISDLPVIRHAITILERCPGGELAYRAAAWPYRIAKRLVRLVANPKGTP